MEQTFKGAGGLNTDYHVLSDGFDWINDYIEAINYQFGNIESGEGYIMSNVPGTLQVDYDLPEGENTVIGWHMDQPTNSVFFFLHNSLKNHSIYRYYAKDRRVVLVMRGEVLGFEKKWRVTGTSFIDNKILQWTDAKDFGNGIEGNWPRKTNTQKAINDGKNKVTRYYFQRSTEAFKNGVQYRLTLSSPLGNPVAGYDESVIYTSNVNGDIDAGIQALADIIDAIPFMSAEACECYLETTIGLPGNYTIKIDTWDPTKMAPGHRVLTVPYNYYPEPLLLEYIDLVKRPPECPPKAEYKEDPDYEYNHVEKKTFQFAYRFIYDDYEKSVFSGISNLAFDSYGCSQRGYGNYIEIDFTDEMINLPEFMALIREVEIIFREGNGTVWKSAARLKPCEWGWPNQIFKFYNDGIYETIPDNEINTQFHSTPIRALSHCMTKNRGHWAGLETDYPDVSDCAELDYDIEYEEITRPKTWTLRGAVRIHNKDYTDTSAYGNCQPVHDKEDGDGTVFGGVGKGNITDNIGSLYRQDLPLNGFVVYLAGTQYNAITKQVLANPDVNEDYDTKEDDFNIFITDTPTQRDGVRNGMVDSDIYQEFEIENIPPGKYILRIASNLCRRDDENGTLYNIENGLGYQSTSLPVCGVGSRNDQKEIIVDLTDPAGGVKQLDIFNEAILVEDITSQVGIDRSTVHDGYVVDAGGDVELENLREEGVRVELAAVEIAYGKSIIADHNGYFYFKSYELNAFSGTKISADLGIGNLEVKSADQLMYEMDISSLVDGGTGQKVIRGSRDPGRYSFIIPCYNSGSLDINLIGGALLEGRIVDQNGKGVRDLRVIPTRGGRVEQTDPEGNFKMRLYRDSTVGGATGFRFDQFVVHGLAGCFFEYTPDPHNFSLTISETGFNFENAFKTSDGLISIALSESKSYLKRGGTYPWGIIYEDRGKRIYPLVRATDDIIKVNYHYDNNIYGRPKVTWKINHKPPLEATHYRIVRAKDTSIMDFFAWVVNDVKYAVRYTGDIVTGEAQETTYDNGDATEIYLGFSNLQTYKDENTDSLLGFPEEVEFDYTGQYIRILFDDNGDFVGEYNLRVKGRRGSYLVIELLESLPEIKAGFTVEVYDPRRTVEDENLVYYKTPECYPILDARTDDRRHGGGVDGQNQIIGTQPATGVLQYGDTYWLNRSIAVVDVDDNISNRYNYPMESERVSDFYASEAESIGQPVVEIGDRQTYMPTLHRFSNTYIPNTRVNNLNEFIAGNQKLFPVQYGAITSLVMAGAVMVQIHKEQLVSIYINERVMVDAVGQQIVSISDEVLGSFRPQQNRFGCINPESVYERDTRVYFWDAIRKSYCRYSNNGVFPISDYKRKQEFQRIGEDYANVSPEEYHVITGFDEQTGRILVSFLPSSYQDNSVPGGQVILFGETHSFEEGADRWKTNYSFIPECYAVIGTQTIGFKNGELWIHNEGDTYNNFYGEQYETKLKIAVAPEVDLNKFWKAVQLLTATHPWDIVEISNSQGQLSRIRKAAFERTEKDWYADFRRDLNTPITDAIVNGDVLRSPELVLTLSQSATEKSTLKGIRVTAEFSKGTVM